MDAGCVENGAQKEPEESLASPLAEDADCEIAGEAVERGSIAKEGAVVPPAFILLELGQSIAITLKEGRSLPLHPGSAFPDTPVPVR